MGWVHHHHHLLLLLLRVHLRLFFVVVAVVVVVVVVDASIGLLLVLLHGWHSQQFISIGNLFLFPLEMAATVMVRRRGNRLHWIG